MLKFGVPVVDKFTGLKGMITHLQVNSNRSEWYIFQPRGINPQNGKPVDNIWLSGDRLVGADDIPYPPDLPWDILGTEVEDVASGFKGIVTSITLHISGCVHANVQPKGIHKKTGQVVEGCDFDVRRLKGKSVKPMSEKKREKDQRIRPSPIHVTSYKPPKI
jgi:hypothetical protein